LRRLLSNRWGVYLLGLGLVIGATLIGELIKTFFNFAPTTMNIFYLLSVVISAFYLGFGPTFMVSILSVLAFDFFFVPPVLTFSVATEQDLINLFILLGAGIAISYLSSRT
jgi:two-component system sensor histidine kinase KdpD